VLSELKIRLLFEVLAISSITLILNYQFINNVYKIINSPFMLMKVTKNRFALVFNFYNYKVPLN
jgi:hypothetical protein